MFNNEQQVQKVYSELSKIKEGIEQLEKLKKDLESKLGKPKVNPVDFREESKYEDPKESKEDTNNFDIKSNYEDPDDPNNLDVESLASNINDFDEKTKNKLDEIDKNIDKLIQELENLEAKKDQFIEDFEQFCYDNPETGEFINNNMSVILGTANKQDTINFNGDFNKYIKYKKIEPDVINFRKLCDSKSENVQKK